MDSVYMGEKGPRLYLQNAILERAQNFKLQIHLLAISSFGN